MSTHRHGLVTIEPHESIYCKHKWLSAAGTHHVNPDRPFKMLLANFSNYSVKLHAKHVVASTKEHREFITESHFTHGVILDIMQSDAKYRKSKKRPRCRQSQKESRWRKTSNTRKWKWGAYYLRILGVTRPERVSSRHSHRPTQSRPYMVRETRTHKCYTHRIQLKARARKFKSTPYHAGTKARELEAFEINRQLNAGFIEPKNADWAILVLFESKKNRLLQLCVDHRKLNTMTVKN